MRLELKALNKNYGSVNALSNFSYVFESGVYGILGGNGAGKSTLIGLLTDTVRRQSGNILLNGKDILECGKTYRGCLGYMAQEQGIYEQMTPLDYLLYIAQLKNVPRKEAKKQIEELLEIVNLNSVFSKKIKTFSGGMRQRLLLSQALLGYPEIIILDEPTAGLDPRERIRIRNYISEISTNKIVILATHIVSDIECIAKEVLLMKNGMLVRSGSVKSLIGDINGKVCEKYCLPEELNRYQKQYGVGNVHQKERGQVLRMVLDDFPEGFSKPMDEPTLEDVYLYFLEK